MKAASEGEGVLAGALLATKPRSLIGWLALCGFIAALTLPALAFSYLPMTDLPQHQAITAILSQPDEGELGFEKFYEVRWTSTLYLLPYLIAVPLEPFAGSPTAMRAVVLLSLLSFPVGLLVLLRSQRRPWPLVFLCAPLVYNRAFFWGFTNFNLALGFSLAAIGLMSVNLSRRRRWVLGVLLTLGALTHPIAVALCAGFACLMALSTPGRASLRAHGPALIPLPVAVALWGIVGWAPRELGRWHWPGPMERFVRIPGNLLGGYRDSSEAGLLAAMLLGFAMLFLLRRRPSTHPQSDERDRSWPQGALLLLLLINFGLYFMLPEHTRTAKYIHFRHLIVAFALLPALLPTQAIRASPRAFAALFGIAGGGAVVTSWLHLYAFDREARSFDEVIAALPSAPRTLYLPVDPDGEVMATAPYLHFAARAQAIKGGLTAVTFPRMFWNLPVRIKNEDQRWWPEQLFDFGAEAHWAQARRSFTHVIVRGDTPPIEGAAILYSKSPWTLYVFASADGQRSP